MKYKNSDTKISNSSSCIVTLLSLSLLGFFIFTKDVTLITLRWPAFQMFQGYKANFLEQICSNLSEEEEMELPPESCDLSQGKWVFDNATRPLYKEEECAYLTSQVTCVKNGRKDNCIRTGDGNPMTVLYQVSTHGSKAKMFLKKLRGKRLLFVGDSANRNLWESMICLLHSATHPARATWKIGAPILCFLDSGLALLQLKQDYNATIEFYWAAPFLVESNSDDPRNHSISQRIMMAESISKHGFHWKDADILVFNTCIWCMNSPTIELLKGSFDEGSMEYDEVERSAYERVLTTWAKWLRQNVDHKRTSTFFVAMSPVHQQSLNWKNNNEIACARETTPIFNMSIALAVGIDRRLLDVARNVIRAIEVPVTLLDINTLSEYRKDVHTSVYTICQGKLLTPEQKADPVTFADCLHWCLPGVPEAWNELIYTYIIRS